jgi:hypothetical protein
LKCPTKQNTEKNTQNPASKASKLVSDQNTRRQRLDRVGSFREGPPAVVELMLLASPGLLRTTNPGYPLPALPKAVSSSQIA